MTNFDYKLLFIVGLLCFSMTLLASAQTKTMKRAAFEKSLLEKAVPLSLQTDIAGGWENAYQYVLVARFLDRRLYERALLQIEQQEGDAADGCAKKDKLPAKLSCAANRAADSASSLTLFGAAVEFRRDAVAYAERMADEEPESIVDALIGLSSDEAGHGRFASAEEALTRAQRLAESKSGITTDLRRFKMAVLRARLADARLDGEAALSAFREAIGAVKDQQGGVWSKLVHDERLADLVASHLRGQFCATCGDPIAAPIKEWIDRLLSGRIDNKSDYGTAYHNYYLLALMAPPGAFTQAELQGYARRYVRLALSTSAYIQSAMRTLPPGLDEITTARYLALSSGIGSYYDTTQIFDIFREKDGRRQVKMLQPLLKSSLEDSFEQFGNESGIAQHFDRFARHFQAAGQRSLACATLQFMLSRVVAKGTDGIQAEQHKLASIYAPAFARLASLDHAAGDERSALGNLDKASAVAGVKLRDEWTYGGAGAILALRDLAPALRLIAQKRSEIATARGVSRDGPGHDALFRALQAAMFGETALTLAVADQRRYLSDSSRRDLRQRHLQAVAEAERVTEIAAYNFESGDVDGALAKARREAEQRRDALAREFAAKVPAVTSAADIEPASLAEVSAHLRSDEALTLLHIGSHGVHGFLLDRTGKSVAWKTSIKREAVEALVRSLRSGGDVTRGIFPPFPFADAAKLYDVIFGPVKDQLGSYSRLVIVGDGPLQSMPYNILLTKAVETPPTTGEELRTSALPWLIRSHAIALMPSVRSFVAQRSGVATGSAGRPFLGVGNPKLADAGGELRNIDTNGAFGSSGSGLADVSILRRLVSLPETADELRTIAKLLNAPEDALLLGGRATEKAIRSMSLSNYKIVAFATHGVLAGQVTGTREPGLVLTPPEQATREDDGFLALSEIANLRFDADLVMLSACNTGASDGRPRAEGLSGLARGFFSAGARSLLVTHWEIPSDSSVKVTTGLIAERARFPDADWAETHRAATLKVIDEEGPAEWAHPAYWGGFAVVGVMQTRPLAN